MIGLPLRSCQDGSPANVALRKQIYFWDQSSASLGGRFARPGLFVPLHLKMPVPWSAGVQLYRATGGKGASIGRFCVVGCCSRAACFPIDLNRDLQWNGQYGACSYHLHLQWLVDKVCVRLFSRTCIVRLDRIRNRWCRFDLTYAGSRRLLWLAAE